MRKLTALLTLSFLAACAPKDEMPPPPAAPTIGDFAGTWNVQSTLPNNPAPIPSMMTGTADAAGWTMSLEGRPNIALNVSMSGDSLVAQSEEYESILRKGVMVSIRTASVKTSTGIAGNIVATYKTATGTEVVSGTLTGTKTP